MKNLVVIRGGGDIASGIAHRLFISGFKVLILEIEKPSCIRRTVSFGEAVYSKEVNIEGVKGILVDDKKAIGLALNNNLVPVYIDRKGGIIKELRPLVVVDSIIAKKNLGTNMNMAPITIGVGPGFEAGKDVNLVVESNRGHNLGKVIHRGRAEKDTGVAGTTLGYSNERVLRAPVSGIIKPLRDIGVEVSEEETVALVEGENIKSQISGLVRGMIKEGLYVKEGMKIGDIDPRKNKDNAFTISDKARAIGGGVLEGILYFYNKRRDLNVRLHYIEKSS